MTEDSARVAYHAARLRISDQEWSLSVDGIEKCASSPAYRLYFHLATADCRIDGLAVDVKTPHTWSPERVLMAVQDAIEHGWTHENDVLVLTD